MERWASFAALLYSTPLPPLPCSSHLAQTLSRGLTSATVEYRCSNHSHKISRDTLRLFHALFPKNLQGTQRTQVKPSTQKFLRLTLSSLLPCICKKFNFICSPPYRPHDIACHAWCSYHEQFLSQSRYKKCIKLGVNKTGARKRLLLSSTSNLMAVPRMP